MSNASQAPGGGAGFAEGIAAHFETFRQDRPGAREFVVTITLIDQEALEFDGLRVDRLPDPPGCVMIQGSSAASKHAVVVREDSIFKAEFQADPEPEDPFGF